MNLRDTLNEQEPIQTKSSKVFSVRYPNTKEQLEMTKRVFNLFNDNTGLFSNEDYNEVPKTSVGNHFLSFIGKLSVFIAIVSKHPR